LIANVENSGKVKQGSIFFNFDKPLFYVKVKKTSDGNNIDGNGRVILAKAIGISGETLLLREYGVDELVLHPTTTSLGNTIYSHVCIPIAEELAVDEIYRRTNVIHKVKRGVIDPSDVFNMFPNVKWFEG
jgi:hypothetical protein